MVAAAIWWTVVLGVVPVAGWLLWWWYDIWYGLIMATLRSSEGGTKLPPGHMGFPIIGEMPIFLWYFNFLRRPDDFINAKRRKYGDGIGMYKTHLFGRPSVIMYSPVATKFVFRNEDSFQLKWPNVELVGKTSLGAVHGKAHLRLRNFLSKSVNQPEALRRIANAVQPRLISALETWAKRGRVASYKEMKKLTFENIGMYFASFQPGPTLNELDKCFAGLVQGFRCYPLNIPGSRFYRAMQCRKKAVGIFKEELERRKRNNAGSNWPINDLLDGLVNLKDEEGNQLSEMEILDNIVVFLIAGFETTAVGTSWAIYYVAQHPKVLQKLRDENLALKASKSGQLATSDEILKLKYTMKVVDEIIRLANITGFIFRTTTRDVKYEGYTIPKGWNAILLLRYIHTNEENYDDPMCFNPDRWDAPMAAGNYQVFGGGSRLCTGNMLARLQIAMFLHHLSSGYKWELMNPDARVKYLPHPKLEDGVEITIEKL